MGIIEKLLCKILPYRDIVKTVDGKETLYLRRFFIRRSKKGEASGDSGGIFLHVIHRNDEDRDRHDHPWKFTSVILRRGYCDETAAGREWVGFGRIVSRQAEHTHRVQGIRPGAPAWTLVFTGPRRRVWGFLTESGWVPYHEYQDLGTETDY